MGAHWDNVRFRFDKGFPPDGWLDLYRACGWYPTSNVDDLRVIRAHAYLIVTAWDGEAMVGTVTVLSDGRNYATIDDLVVHPVYRRQGIGSELVRLALGRLTAIDCGVIKLVAVPGVEPSYERLGFQPTRETVMSLAASQPSLVGPASP